MVIDLTTALGAAGTLVGVIWWASRIETSVRLLRRRCELQEAHQSIILRGLCRLNVVRQEDIDLATEKVADRHTEE